jgi:NAD-dependent SIR2 family protein deacetylase
MYSGESMIGNRNCDCAICKHQHDIDIPLELVNQILSGNATLFTGAGISTESRSVMNTTFYETIASKITPEQNNLDFPTLMEAYCDQPNGRFKLLTEIKGRFDTVDSFPELKQSATRFHKELGTLFPIKNIITTNWDTYFERYCKATPFVVDSDLAFWEAAERRVLKIHGSIDNLSTIVATNKDYKLCEERLNIGLIGSLLKTILATQTVIFIGYSLSDTDFSEIYSYVKKQMDQLHKQAYIVTPFEADAEKFRELGLIPIITDGSYFLSLVKEHAVHNELMLSDSIFEYAADLLEEVREEHINLHEQISAVEFPQVIHTTTYQDGLMHALERAIEMRNSGTYSHRCKLSQVASAYDDIKTSSLRNKAYNTVAYIEGYLNGLLFLLLDEEEREEIYVPLYFAFGSKDEVFDFESLKEFLVSKPNAHKASLKSAKKILDSVNDPESIVFHHPPWL